MRTYGRNVSIIHRVLFVFLVSNAHIDSLTGSQVLSIVYFDQLSGARHTHISYYDRRIDGWPLLQTSFVVSLTIFRHQFFGSILAKLLGPVQMNSLLDQRISKCCKWPCFPFVIPCLWILTGNNFYPQMKIHNFLGQLLDYLYVVNKLVLGPLW